MYIFDSVVGPCQASGDDNSEGQSQSVTRPSGSGVVCGGWPVGFVGPSLLPRPPMAAAHLRLALSSAVKSARREYYKGRGERSLDTQPQR
jgi:hypothetical protein